MTVDQIVLRDIKYLNYELVSEYAGYQIYGRGNHRLMYDPKQDRIHMRYDFNELSGTYIPKILEKLERYKEPTPLPIQNEEWDYDEEMKHIPYG